jgi:hypothetical protein
MTINSSGTGQGGWCLVAQTGGYLLFSNLIFGTAVTGHMIANFGGTISVLGGYVVHGSAPVHMLGSGGQFVYDSGAPMTITVASGVAFSTCFAYVDGASLIAMSQTTFSGTGVTGRRYIATNGGYINGTAGNINFFPGSIAGTSTTGYYT